MYIDNKMEYFLVDFSLILWWI